MMIPRDEIELEETYAKSSIVQKENYKFGIINLPKFYIDFEDVNSRNATSDVKREIERLKGEGMDGLVLDLRNNGGGSLKTAVEIGGLFIKEGPIVQVRSTGMNSIFYFCTILLKQFSHFSNNMLSLSYCHTVPRNHQHT